MKLFRVLIALLVAALLLCGAYWFVYQDDIAKHTGIVELHTGLTVQDPGAGPVSPGETRSLAVSLENHSYDPISVRHTFIVSVYSGDGDPVPINGRSDTLSDLELYHSQSEDPIRPKLLREHRAIYLYTEEIRLGGAEKKYRFPFEETVPDPAAAAHVSEYTLRLVPEVLDQYLGCVIKVDLITETKPDGSDTWVRTATSSAVVGGTLPDAIAGEPVEFPSELYSTTTFLWEVENGTAYICGLGGIVDADIVIPARISLSPASDGAYAEDPINGTVYPVGVRSDAFMGCDRLRSVVFEEGVAIQGNSMWDMFSGCSALVSVRGIPNTVTSMAYAFANCVSLVEPPELPAAATNLNSCFAGCVSLIEAPEIPENALSMDRTFMDCVSLTAAPEIPESVTRMSYTFSGCASLEAAPYIPDSVTNLQHCFSRCDALDGNISVPYLSESFGSMDSRYLTNITYRSPGVDSVQIRSCRTGLNAQAADRMTGETPAIFTIQHVSEGICPGCRTVNMTVVIDGLTTTFENIPEDIYLWLADVIDHEVPDALKQTCSALIITDDLEKYGGSKYSGTEYGGFARYPEGTAHVRLPVEHIKWGETEYISNMRYVLFHELAHCYDHNFSSWNRFSGSGEWSALHGREEIVAELYYNEEHYRDLSPNYKKKETFAIAVGKYFTASETLQSIAPGMYAYVDALFGEAAEGA